MLLRWCERSGVSYIVGLAQQRAAAASAWQYAEACAGRRSTRRSGTKQRLIDEFGYAADSWDHERRVITRLEHGDQGTNPRFVVTNLEGDAGQLYERLYCARGEAENRIKEAQLDLFGRRASCHRFAANQLRLLLAALAYTLMMRPAPSWRSRARSSSAPARPPSASAAQDRRGHLRNTRRVRVLLASHHPLRSTSSSPRRTALAPVNLIQCCPRHADKQRG